MNRTFHSPTHGPLSFFNVIEHVVDYMDAEPRARYRVIVGSDSQVHQSSADFVVIVALHRVGSGGRYFWAKERRPKVSALRHRIYEEAALSLRTAQELLAALQPAIKHNGGDLKYNLEIHVDIGPNGPSRAMIQEIVGMIKGSGFEVKTKPEAYGAFVVADKHT